MRHKCHALKCDIAVHPKFLMCPKHWRKVPKNLQNDVLHFYVPGQEIKKNPTLDYLTAAWVAIFAVADIEGISYDANTILRKVALRFAATKTSEQLDAIVEQHKTEVLDVINPPDV